MGMWVQVLERIDKEPARFLEPEGLVVTQIDPKEEKELQLANLELIDRRRYGSTLLLFYEPLLNVT
jgi:16S rRNA G966 N2-methylase RsmD